MENTVKAPIRNRLMLWAAERFYAIARWCEGEAINVVVSGSKSPVFSRPRAADMPPAGYFGILKLDVNHPDVRAGLLRGYVRSPNRFAPVYDSRTGKTRKKVKMSADVVLAGVKHDNPNIRQDKRHRAEGGAVYDPR